VKIDPPYITRRLDYAKLVFFVVTYGVLLFWNLPVGSGR